MILYESLIEKDIYSFHVIGYFVHLPLLLLSGPRSRLVSIVSDTREFWTKTNRINDLSGVKVSKKVTQYIVRIRVEIYVQKFRTKSVN